MRIEEVTRPLALNEKRIFALRSDFVLATGVKNAEQHHGYEGLKETFDASQYPYLNWSDRYGHTSLAIPDENYDGRVYYAGFVCQREGHLSVFLSSGRFNRCHREAEGINPLTNEQTQVIETYLTLKFLRAYGNQKIIFYNTTPGDEDDADSALYFTNTPFPATKPHRLFSLSDIKKGIHTAMSDAHTQEAKQYIQSFIPPVKPTFLYPGEGCLNPGYQPITSVSTRLRLNEKRIWVLRSDFILATGVKNAYEKEYGYTGFKEAFSEPLHKHLNWNDRYGHPSLTLPEGDYDGSAFYAGYVCQRQGFLQVYLVSGRFERFDLNETQTQRLEAYIASQFLTAYGNQTIVFNAGDSDDPKYHTTFFSDGKFGDDVPTRCYTEERISQILQSIPKQLEGISDQRRHRP